ncbi:MAG: methyltransferase [Candidatus Stygibacter frigidus]|nr:methyltransferase [Candidatus Stygibacter frigidus]
MQASLESKAVELPFGKIIYQSTAGQGISSDSAFLVETVLREESELPMPVLDLGSGNGIIALMLKYYRPDWQISGIEILPYLVELAESNAQACGEDIAFVEADIKEYTSQQPYELMVSNPPYLPKDKGRISPVYERAIARHEILCELKDVLLCIKRNLADQGRAYICNLSTRAEEIKELVNHENMVLDKIYPDLSFQKEKMNIFRIKK